MAGDKNDKSSSASTPTSVGEMVSGIEPMGDLGRFVIDDLTPDEEDEFFRILEDA